MKTTILRYFERLRGSLWFLPSLMVLGAAAVAFAAVAFDRAVADRRLAELVGIYNGGPQGASAILSTIAGSTVTLAGVVFSMTLVALTLASSHFGPLLLRNFMEDRLNQIVIGAFVGTFLYCLLVLRTLRHDDADPFVPQFAVTLGMLFALASLVLLIYFIHHVAASLQAEQITARVGAELMKGVDRLFPAQAGEEAGDGGAHDGDEAREGEAEAALARDARLVGAQRDGYLQIVDGDALVRIAAENDVVIGVTRAPGDYFVEGMPLARVAPRAAADDALAGKIRGAFAIGQTRTPAQDLRFAIHQLVEVALRALSPGVNEPFTAITCIDRLGSALCRLAQREIPSRFRRDDDGRVRLIAPVIGFVDVTDAAFGQIRPYAAADATVTLRLLRTIAMVAPFATRSEDRAALARHAELIARDARAALANRDDRRAVDDFYLALREALDETRPRARRTG